MNNACKIIILAKAPVAGYAKTRLGRAIGDAAAAQLAARMLDETVHQAISAGLGPVEICCAPDTRHPRLSALAMEYCLELTCQGEGDIGRRMERVFARELQNYQKVIVIGTDAPDLRVPALWEAAEALSTHDAVIAPAHDGGYVLVGLRKPVPGMFEGIDWSTDRVMSQTRLRFVEAKVDHFELATFHDVDEADDLVHIPAGWFFS